MRRILLLLMAAALAVPATAGTAQAAPGPQLDACRFVSTADAAALLGAGTSRLPHTGRDCLYVAIPSAAGTPSPSLLVQARRWRGEATVPHFGTETTVSGARRCFTVQLQGLTLACYRDGRLLSVTAMDTPDDTATATAAMKAALGNLR